MSDEKYEHKEYPKALTAKAKDGRGDTRFVALVYPAGHVRHGQHVIFNNAEEEKAYDKSGIAADVGPEQVSAHGPTYLYDPWNPWIEN